MHGHGTNFTNFSVVPANKQITLFCLLKDSLVKTPVGDVKVQLLKKGDYVLNEQNKPKKIVNINNTFRKDITEKKEIYILINI